MQPTAQCEEATCVGMMCGVGDKAAGEDCSEGGGKKCDGGGNCVGCLTNADCAGTPATPVCNMTGNVCVSGQCTDMQKNGNETDIDCGGGACADCPINKTCGGASDCLSGFCQMGAPNKCAACASQANCASGEFCDATINGGTCEPKVGDGNNCTADNQCVNAHCVGSGLKICCNTSCNSTCLTCFAAEKASGMGDGTCGPAQVLKDPNNDCPTSGSNDCQQSTCDGVTAGGKCGVQPASVTCGQTDTCTNAKFTQQQHCNGVSDTCAAPTMAQDCPNHFACQDASACATSCSVTGGGPSGTSIGCAPSFFCQSPTNCVAKLASGQVCLYHFQCVSDNCVTNICQ